MRWLNPRNWFSKPAAEEPKQEERLPGKFLVINAGFEDDGKLRLEVEYDDEFVQSLRSRGYVGTDDHQMVMKYVGDVYRTISNNTDPQNYD